MVAFWLVACCAVDAWVTADTLICAWFGVAEILAVALATTDAGDAGWAKALTEVSMARIKNESAGCMVLIILLKGRQREADNQRILEYVSAHRSRRQFLLSAASLAAANLRLHGQETEPIFSSNVKVVNTLVTVQNRSGELIKDLKQEDFNLLEDGRPQTIRYFSQQSDLPLTLGLMVDTSMSQGRVMDAERGASMQFLEQLFRENKDHVFLMQFWI